MMWQKSTVVAEVTIRAADVQGPQSFAIRDPVVTLSLSRRRRPAQFLKCTGWADVDAELAHDMAADAASNRASLTWVESQARRLMPIRCLARVGYRILPVVWRVDPSFDARMGFEEVQQVCAVD